HGPGPRAQARPHRAPAAPGRHRQPGARVVGGPGHPRQRPARARRQGPAGDPLQRPGLARGRAGAAAQARLSRPAGTSGTVAAGARVPSSGGYVFLECPVDPKPLIAPLVLGIALALGAPASAQAPVACECDTSAVPQAAESEADRLFTKIHEEEWAWRQAQYGRGEDVDASRMYSVDPASQQARLEKWEQVLAALDGIDEDQLSPANRIHLAVYRPQIENLAADIRLRGYEMPFNSDSSFWSNLAFMARGRMEDAGDYRDYIGRLNDVPRHFDQQIANMRAGLARGFSVPRAVLDGRDVSIAMVAELEDPEQSPLYEPFKRMPASIPAGEQEQLRQAAREAIRDSVVPAHRELLTFFREEYVPQARTTLGATQMPGGEEYYAQQIREYTTLDLTPDEIHRIGLDEVARIRAEMDEVIAETGFEGSFEEFIHFLRTDPQFYATTPEELLHRAAWIAKR